MDNNVIMDNYCFIESTGAMFSWSGVLIKFYHGNNLHVPVKDYYKNDYFHLSGEPVTMFSCFL